MGLPRPDQPLVMFRSIPAISWPGLWFVEQSVSIAEKLQIQWNPLFMGKSIMALSKVDGLYSSTD